MKRSLLSFVAAILIAGTLISQEKVAIDFNSDNFKVLRGKIVDFEGRTAFLGNGYIPELSFKNGIIEVDFWMSGERSYPGVNFRVQSPGNHEHFYVRPHRVGLYPDALQYTPSTNGNSAWQLYNGRGFTSAVELPYEEWIHLRIEVKDEQARVYFNDRPFPDLEIFNLIHGNSEGSISLNSPMNGTAYFSNLSYTQTDKLEFETAPMIDVPAGLITEWEISNPYSMFNVEFDKSPNKQILKDLKWTKATVGEKGLVNISDLYARISRATDIVWARTSIHADSDSLLELRFGYSDAVSIFLNDEILFSGNSAYRHRDPSFLGIIGFNDAIYLPLKKGNNELIFAVAESFGGWGFMAKKGSATIMEGVSKQWEAEGSFLIPESVVYDSKRNVLYITNFDQMNMGNPAVSQYITTMDLDGNILETHWVDDLNNPLGMTIYNDYLYVAERNQIAVINLESKEIVERIPVEGSAFLNDLTIDKNGTLYITDSRKNLIWRHKDGETEAWLSGSDVIDPNVLYIHNDKLYFGNSGDSWLKTVDLNSKEITNIVRLPEGFIDGIRADGKGNLLVSLWKGKIYMVSPEGEINQIFNTENLGDYTADFEYIIDKNQLVIPTFYSNKVCSYYLND